MRRTEADGHDTNRYTEGNPTLGVPATVVGATEMNLIQEEISNVIEAEGITLDATGADEDQLNDALDLKVAQGGSQIVFSIDNNISSATDVTGIVLDNSSHIGSSIEFYLQRQTDSEDVVESGTIYLAYDPVATDWKINTSSVMDDAGVTFSVTSAGQLQYTSTNMSGGSYAGTLKTIVRKIKS